MEVARPNMVIGSRAAKDIREHDAQFQASEPPSTRGLYAYKV